MIHGKPEFMGEYEPCALFKTIAFVKFLAGEREIPYNVKLITFSYKKKKKIALKRFPFLRSKI